MFKKIWIGLVLLVLAAGVVACGKADSQHIIPDIPPTPPAPKTHNYIYNPVEYQIAMWGAPIEWLEERLREKGYNLSRKEIDDFRKQHGIKTGEIVLVRGKVIGEPISVGYGVRFESLSEGGIDASAKGERPQWVSDALKKVRAGEEVIVTVRGVAKNGILIRDCELIE